MKTAYIKAARALVARFADAPLPQNDFEAFKSAYGDKGMRAAQRFATVMRVDPIRRMMFCPGGRG